MLEPLIESQRQLVPLLVYQSPEINPTLQNRDGVDVPLVEPLRFEESDCPSDRPQLNVLPASVSVCTLPVQLQNQSARNEEAGDDNFVVRKCLLFQKQELLNSKVFVDLLPPEGSSNLEAFEPVAVNESHCNAPEVVVLQEEISNQLVLGVIDKCDDVLGKKLSR